MWTYETCYFFFEYGLCLLLIAYTIMARFNSQMQLGLTDCMLKGEK